jgi:hypothetical protein
MKRRTISTATVMLLTLLGLTSPAIAQDRGLLGEWEVVTTGFSFVGSGTRYMDLSIEEQGGEFKAYIFTGPAPIRVNGKEFEVDLEWRSGFDVEYISTFKGLLQDDGTLKGTTTHHGATSFTGREWKDGAFTATHAEPSPDLEGLEPSPVDLSGIWRRASGLGAVSSFTYSMTERGQEIIDNYLEIDNANSRCASPGLVLATGLPYPIEILNGDGYVVMVHGADYARRIYLDGREFPETATSSSFGFSRGEWKGETLVVTTDRLDPTFLSTRGQPLSENAKTIENFYYDRKGYLHADMWVHDPQNYTRPPHLRRVYDRDFSQSVITKVDCDPYSFFRALDLEGELDTFWERSEYRR